ncbi:MAG: low temperature requirement protein A [Gammaproteobacteria bacterium]|jgi:low temperature requirement protein LtrA
MSRYIHKTTLRTPHEKLERHMTWLEIFFDLIMAVVVIQLSDKLSANLSVQGVIESAALFIPTMWVWVSYTIFAARFDNNDVIHWLMTFIIMFAGVIMAIQIPSAFEAGANGFALGFLLSQITLLLLYSRAFFEQSTPRNMLYLYMIGFGLATLCWFISLFVTTEKFWFWFLGMLIYLITPWIGRKHILSKVPLNPIYIPERFGAFTMIIIGQLVASVVFGLEVANWHLNAVLTSIMSFIFAALIWGQYYRFIQTADYTCSLGSGQPYIYHHIPMIISMIIMGACVQELIKNSTFAQGEVYSIFCFAIILYLLSFYSLYYLTLIDRKLPTISYLIAIIGILFLFFTYHFTPAFLMLGLVIVFSGLMMVNQINRRI